MYSDSIQSVKRQYERFPYPPIPFLALPLRRQGSGLSYELGTQLSRGIRSSHRDVRILVAGGGTLEPLVVAQTHPYAAEIVVVDLSQTSLHVLKRRMTFARFARFSTKRPPLRFICQDLSEGLDSLGKFDFVIASNLLHHLPDPSAALQILASSLNPKGLIRIVTYPKMSRIWMRETAKWFRLQGLTPDTPHLVQKARKSIQTLPEFHPVRSCFENHPEVSTATGIVDAFMHACENPLSPLEWKTSSQKAGLRLIGETQTETSRSSFLDEIVPELKSLDTWSKIQILDDLLEICSNPILWFELVEPQAPPVQKRLNWAVSEGPTSVFWQMKQGLLRIQGLLEGTGIDLEILYARFKTEVGPRYGQMGKAKNIALPGLSLTDYPLQVILETQEPKTS